MDQRRAKQMWAEAADAEDKSLEAVLRRDEVAAKALAIYAQKLRDEVMAWNAARSKA